jgi:hypothetical protein
MALLRASWPVCLQAAAWCGRSGSFELAVSDDSSSGAEFSGRLGHEHTRKPGMTVSLSEDSARDRFLRYQLQDQQLFTQTP